MSVGRPQEHPVQIRAGNMFSHKALLGLSLPGCTAPAESRATTNWAPSPIIRYFFVHLLSGPHYRDWEEDTHLDIMLPTLSLPQFEHKVGKVWGPMVHLHARERFAKKVNLQQAACDVLERWARLSPSLTVFPRAE